MVRAGEYGLRARTSAKQARRLQVPFICDTSWSSATEPGLAHRAPKQVLSSEDLVLPAAYASIAAGLRPGVLTKAELVQFRGRHSEYLDARSMILPSKRIFRDKLSYKLRDVRRNHILQCWDADVTQYLIAEACVGTVLHFSSKHCRCFRQCLSSTTVAGTAAKHSQQHKNTAIPRAQKGL